MSKENVTTCHYDSFLGGHLGMSITIDWVYLLFLVGVHGGKMGMQG